MKIEKDIILIISEYIITKLRECNKKATPIEACGLIFGNVTQIETSKEITKFSILLKNSIV